MPKKAINSFNAGELSPYLYARSDLDKYQSGCLTMENFTPLPYGGATRRPAIEYKFDTVGNDKVRLIPFVPTVENSYILAIGNQEINVYQNGTLKDTIVAPWLTAEHNDIKYTQSIDVMWLTHPDHPVQRLERVSDTSWTIADVEWDFPPLIDENEEDIFLDLTFSETAWVTATGYILNDVRQFDGIVFRCVFAHTSGTFVSDYRDGFWIASNTGVTATLNSYDAESAGSNFSLFTADMVGQDIVINNERNSIKVISSGAIGAGEPRNNVSEYFSDYLSPGASGDFFSGMVNASFSNWEFSAELTSATATITVERSLDNGITWNNYVFIGSVSDAVPKSFSFSSDEEEAANTWLRFKYEDLTGSGVVMGISIVDTPVLEGVATITAFTDAHTVDIEIKSNVQADLSTGITGTLVNQSSQQIYESTRTDQFSFGAFSDSEGHPTSIAMFENRLTFAGTSNNPGRIWMSRLDDFQNFQLSDIDTGSIDLTLNSGTIDEIRWMVPQERLIIGTAGGEWSLGASDERKAITPTGFDLKRKTSYGSNDVQAILVNSAVLFLMRQSRKVREWTPNFTLQDYVAPDLTILAEHITDGGIVQWDYQQQPDNVLWGIRTDGTLLGFTYERDQNVTGWHRHNNDEFLFESVAIIPRDNEEDEVWVSVNMGGTRMVGRLNDREWGTDYLTEWQGSDLYVTYSSPGTATLTGLDHLEGKTVVVVADGVIVDSAPSSVTVSGLTGGDAVDNGVYDFNGLVASKPSYKKSGAGTIESTGSIWEFEGTFYDDSITSSADLPPTTGWPVGGGGTSPTIVHNNVNIVSGGIITVYSSSYTTVTIGLAFTSTLAPLFLNIENQYGTSRGGKVSNRQAHLHFKDTFSAKVGQDVADLELVEFENDENALYSEIVPTWFDNASDWLMSTYVVQDEPMPCTILAMITDVEVN